MAGQSLGDVIEIIGKSNEDLAVVGINSFTEEAATEFVMPMIQYQKDILKTLESIQQGVFRIEKNMVRMLLADKANKEAIAAAAGMGRVRGSEEPEAVKDKSGKVVNVKEKDSFDFVDALTVAGLSFMAFKAKMVASLSEMFQDVVDTIWGWFKGVMPALQKLGHSKIAVAIKTFATKLKPFFTRFGKILTTIGAKLGSMLSMLPGTAQIAKFLGILGSLARVIAMPITIAFTMWEGVKKLQENLQQLGSDASMFDKIATGIYGFLGGAVGYLIGGLADLVKSAISWAFSKMGATGVSELLDAFSFEDLINYAADVMRDIVIGVADGIKKIASSIVDGPGVDFFSGLTDIWKSITSLVTRPIGRIVTGVANIIGVDIPESLKPYVEDAGKDNNKVEVNADKSPAAMMNKYKEDAKRAQEYREKKETYDNTVASSSSNAEIISLSEKFIETANQYRGVITPIEYNIGIETAQQNIAQSHAATKIEKSSSVAVEKGTVNNRQKVTTEMQRSLIEREAAVAMNSGGGNSSPVVVSAPSSSNVVQSTTNVSPIPLSVSDSLDPAGVTYQSVFSGR